MRNSTPQRVRWPVLLLLLSACGRPPAASSVKEIWNDDNDPLLLSGKFDRQFDKLPITGRLGVVPWTDTYWPSNFGGIASRWNSPVKDNFSYTSPTEVQVRQMSLAQLALLSPAEKYDIYAGDFSYPTVELERERVGPQDSDWEGLCHGWAPAALNFSEPKPVLVTSAKGIKVPFGSSDVKALLTYYEGQLANAESRQLGTRCDIDLAKHPNAPRRHPECRGINAGSFHIALSNFLGKDHNGFVADVSHGNQIWNQPVYGFDTKVVQSRAPSPGAATTAVREVLLHTDMLYTDDVDAAWEAQGTTDDIVETVTYDYTVEIDGNGEVVGGAWVGKELLDFIWTQDKPVFDGYYKDINTLYQLSLKGPEQPLLQKQKQPHPDPAPHSGART